MIYVAQQGAHAPLVDLNLWLNRLQSWTDLKDNSLRDLLPDTVTNITLANNLLSSWYRCQLPKNLVYLCLADNRISDWEGCDLPSTLKELILENNLISSWHGCRLPEGLIILKLAKNHISDWDRCELPNTLRVLDLSGNRIGTWLGPNGETLHDILPIGVHTLHLSGNPLTDWYGCHLPVRTTNIELDKTPLILSSINNKPICHQYCIAYTVRTTYVSLKIARHWRAIVTARRFVCTIDVSRSSAIYSDMLDEMW
jgi:hypothetical protein